MEAALCHHSFQIRTVFPTFPAPQKQIGSHNPSTKKHLFSWNRAGQALVKKSSHHTWWEPVGPKETDPFPKWTLHSTLGKRFHLPAPIIALGQLGIHLRNKLQLQECTGISSQEMAVVARPRQEPWPGHGKGIGDSLCLWSECFKQQSRELLIKWL